MGYMSFEVREGTNMRRCDGRDLILFVQNELKPFSPGRRDCGAGRLARSHRRMGIADCEQGAVERNMVTRISDASERLLPTFRVWSFWVPRAGKEGRSAWPK